MLKRRQFLVSASAMAVSALVARRADARVGAAPPAARTVDVVDQRFGLSLPDPFRWMEDADHPDWMPFMRGQADFARAILDGLPQRDRISRRVSEISNDLPAVNKLRRVGARTFVEYRPTGAANFKLYVIDAPDGQRRLLYDPERESSDEGHRSLDYWAVSPDGERVAFGSSLAGSEDSMVRLLKVSDGSLLPDRLDRAQYARLSWLPDSSGFFLARLREGSVRGASDYYENSAVWLHRLGGGGQGDQRIVGGGDSVDGYSIAASEFPALITDPSSHWTLLQAAGASRRYNPVFVARTRDLLKGAARWRAVLSLSDEVTNFTLRGDSLYFVSERGAPNGCVLKLDLSAPERGASVVAAESDYPIEPTAHGTLMAAALDGVYFVRTQGGSQTIYRVDQAKRVIALEMPFEAGVHDLFADTRADGLDVGMAGWLHPFAIWRYAPGRGWSRDASLSPPTAFDLNKYKSWQIVAHARDGVQVPVSVVARRGLPRDGSAPCLARCYSAYGISATPSFNPRLLALLERGAVFAQVHARGGGEFGSRWWRAGQRQSKPNTWRDFIDGCQALVDAGLTSTDRLTIMGGSAGGVAVGRALTERPEMFAGAIFSAAFTNPTRLEAEPTGPASYAEFGDPRIEADFRALYVMDTYQHVRDGGRYPAVLIMHGITDSRVAPWHSAKLAARLQRANASGEPMLLRVLFDAGHGPGSTRSQVDDQWTDMIAFVLSRAKAARRRR